MSSNMPLVLPRPGDHVTPSPPIPGPSEEAFTSAFGKLFPPAQYVTTSHGRAAYYEYTPTTPATGRVLLLHGVQTPALGLYPLARALRAARPGAHIVLLDWWGHGLSDTPVLPHEGSLFHGLADALLDHLGWADAHLLGFSMGAVLAAGYTARHPGRVSSLTVVAPAGMIDSGAFPEEGRAAVARECEDEEAASRWIVGFLEGGERVVPPDWRERVARGEVVALAMREWQTREHGGHNATVVAAFRDAGIVDGHGVFDEVARTGVARLAVLGELDDLSDEEGVRGRGFGDVRVVRGATHEVVRTHVDEVAGAVGEFWGGLGLR